MRFVAVRKASKARPSTGQQKAVQHAANTAAPQVVVDFLKASDVLQDSVSSEVVRDLLRRGALDQIDLPWETFEEMLRRNVPPHLIAAIRRSAEGASQFTAETLRKALGYRPLLVFDGRNPRLQSWVKANTGEMIRDVTRESKAAVKVAVQTALSRELSDIETFRAVRRSIGLSERQLVAVQNVYHRNINEGLDRDEAMRQADEYAQRSLTHRARLIAHHETMTAANQGLNEGWEQAADEGFFKREDAEAEWDAAPGDRTCPTCENMDGERRPIDGEWTVPILNSKGETVDVIRTDNVSNSHPGCRCTALLRLR